MKSNNLCALHIVTDDEINIAVDEFIASYFNEIQTYITMNYEWFSKHNLIKKNNIDYFKIRRFLVTATTNLLELDRTIRSGVLDALITDVEYMYSYYENILVDTKYNLIIMEKHFLKTYTPYIEIKEQLEDNMRRKELYESQEKKSRATMTELEQIAKLNREQMEAYKVAKRQNVDAIHYSQEARELVSYLYEQEKSLKSRFINTFDEKFEEAKNSVLTSLIDIINNTYYCLEQTLWHYAENSQSVKRFFRVSQIKGDFSLRTYIDYYLKGISNTSSSQEVKDLHEVLKALG